jgi:hypothetical protein
MRNYGPVFLIGAFLGAIALVGFLAYPSNALGAQNCDFKDALDNLKSITNDKSLEQLDKIRKELEARKNTLRIAVDCAITEAKDSESAVKSIPASTEEIERVRKQFSLELENVIRYYENKKSQINDLGIAGTKDVARDIKNRRGGNLIPIAENVKNLSIWSKNQDLITAAQNRLNQISQTVNTLKLNDKEGVQGFVDQANENIKNTKIANQEAKKAFESYLGPELILSPIKSSLDYLSKTYTSFLDISEAIRK